MTGRIVRLELGQLWRDPRVRWSGAILALLLTLSFVTALHGTIVAAAEQRQVTRNERQRWLAQPEKNPHTAAHYGVWAIKRSSPLRLLDPGIEPFTGSLLKLEAHQRKETVFRPLQDGDPIQRVGTGHVAGLLQLFAPLAIILLGFTAFAVDRERGTLRLALGNGASPQQLLTARFIALLAITAIVVIGPAAVLGMAAIVILPGEGWHAASRLLAWVLAYFSYAIVFLLIAMAVSLVARSARAALTALLLIWVVLCVAAPRVASAWIDEAAPLPSHQATLARVAAINTAYDSAENWAVRRRATMRAYGVASEGELPIDLRGAQLVDSERHGWGVFDRLLGGFYDKVEWQDHLYGMAGFASPAIGIANLSSGLAGTDFHQHRAYLDDAERYRRGMVMRLNYELRDHPVKTGETMTAGTALWDRIPAFAYRPVPLVGVWPTLGLPLLSLLVWLVAAGGVTIAAARRVGL